MLKKLDLSNKKALLIDCDGTLAETMSSHNKAYEIAFALNGVPFDMEEHEKWAPYGGAVLMNETVVKRGFGDKVDDIILDKQRFLGPCLEKFMKPNKELIELIKNRPTHVKAYVVTNGRRQSIMKVLNALGVAYVVDGLIPRELVEKAKPFPDPYNYAMNLLGVEPHEVIVFEDNDIGIRSARKAGISLKDIVLVNPNEF